MSKPIRIVIEPTFNPHEAIDHEAYGPCEKLVIVLTDHAGLFNRQQMSDLKGMIRDHRLRGEQAFLGVETHGKSGTLAVYLHEGASPLAVRRMIRAIIQQWENNGFKATVA